MKQKTLPLKLILVFFMIASLLFGAVDRGLAQETPPAAETATPLAEPSPSITPSSTVEPFTDVTQVLVKTSPNARVGRVQERTAPFGRVIESEELAKLGVIVMEIPSARLEQAMNDLLQQSGVASVELDHAVWAADVIPNDPGWALQYNMTAIRAPQGWGFSTGAGSVTIAVLDSGVDASQADFSGRITAGYDFVNDDNDPRDDAGHGTHVAGIAAAQGNNGTGIAGVSWGAQIMPVKVLNLFGGGSYSDVAAGIVWAVDHGAQVINLSLGGAQPSSVLQAAVEYAYQRGVLLVAASGNNGGGQVLYPARYPQVIAVGAINASNLPASFSNYGAEVDVAAPGENITSLWPGGTFIQSGTSMAAPHVSGLAAVLFSFISSADGVRGAIESSALDVGPAGWDPFSGAGLIQMDAALLRVMSPPATEPAPKTFVAPVIPIRSSVTPSLTAMPSITPSVTLPATASSPEPSATIESVPPVEVTLEVQEVLSQMTPIAALRWGTLVSPASCGGLGLIAAGLALWMVWKKRHRS